MKKYLIKTLIEGKIIQHGKQSLLKQISNMTANETDYGTITFEEHHQIQKAIKKILKI